MEDSHPNDPPYPPAQRAGFANRPPLLLDLENNGELQEWLQATYSDGEILGFRVEAKRGLVSACR